MNDAPRSSRPSAEERKQQILDAAVQCVRRAGFHGATMAEIAKIAGLSVGQIYRYFANKEAIIAAIVEQDQADMRAKFAELNSAGEGPASTLLQRTPLIIERRYESDRAGLVLEVMAEAARNPNVAGILRTADKSGRALIRELLDESVPGGVSSAERDARVEILSILLDGMVMRAVLNPEADQKTLAEFVRVIWRQLLLGAPANEAAAD